MRDIKDYYKILGIAKNASPEEIKKAYKRLAFEFHPDRNCNDPLAEEKFKAVSEAHEILSNPEKRREYDLGHIVFSSFTKKPSKKEPIGLDEITIKLHYRGNVSRDRRHSHNPGGPGFYIWEKVLNEENEQIQKLFVNYGWFPGKRHCVNGKVEENFIVCDSAKIIVRTFGADLYLSLDRTEVRPRNGIEVEVSKGGTKPKYTIPVSVIQTPKSFIGYLTLSEEANLELDIKTELGFLRGLVAHRGRIYTDMASINLKVEGDTGIILKTSDCKKKYVEGFKSIGNRQYRPPHIVNPSRIINIESESIDVIKGSFKIQYQK